ncbi:putative RNA uridine N3 methyltransferase [Sulfurisphaera javensis]|uniref:RNA uridine N3 methyltransferase n=1 Tax=Sulfurisphaera javensis TaxID=2049879 RepID=A0AAT9GRP6_9CREN
MIFPYPRRKDLNIILFTSIFSTEKSLAEITIKLSYIIRILAIFRVSNLYWISDYKNKKIIDIISDIIDYALLPPYLKKEIPIKKNLKKVGLLNPINIPSHIVSKEPIEGEYRLGKKGIFGLKNKLKTNARIILITNTKPLQVKEYTFYPYYLGFKMHFIDYEKLRDFNNLIIASRSGKNPLEFANEIRSLYEREGISLLIGPPQGGLLKKEVKSFEHIYNFIPNQGVKDIRAEEALVSSLSILNFILG